MSNIPAYTGLKGCFFSLLILAFYLTSCEKDKVPVDNDPVTAAFAYNLTPNCPVPCQVCFTNNSQNATTYAWDFGNGQTSSLASPCVTYATRSTFTVTLTASKGTESVTTTQTLTIQDNIERYKRTFTSNATGIVTNLLKLNGYTYVLMQVDGITKMVRFNSTSESYANFPGTITVNDMVADVDGNILCAGNYGYPSSIGFTRLSSAMNLDFERIYNLGYPAYGYSIVPKNTNNTPGYILGGQVNNSSSSQAALVNTFDNGDLYFSDPVAASHTVKRIFRNPDHGDFSYVAIGEWFDPLYQKSDIHIFTVNENGVDHFPIGLYPGIDNTYNDVVNDAVQYGDGASYAVVGNLNGKPSFFTFKYHNQSFTAPVIIQRFSSNSLTLQSICALANNQGFGVCGTESTGVFGEIYIFVAKLDNDGAIVWRKTFPTKSAGKDIIATPDGGFLLGGQEICSDLTCSYPVLYKLDSNGDFE